MIVRGRKRAFYRSPRGAPIPSNQFKRTHTFSWMFGIEDFIEVYSQNSTNFNYLIDNLQVV